jgi:hypothetical protein
MIELKRIIERIVEEQNDRHTLLVGSFNIPVDIRLSNGNILLRSFRIIELKKDRIKGITRHEEYSAPRENRRPRYSYFDLDEIEQLECFDLDECYSKSTLVNKA